ncbi:alpha/beta hydrolase [Agilicoccus flavus]|uniref:alpha/beta hydrolase n=1 Tax=Agilicoccus flavus TaxID=2775968 RepID=UPI001CF629A2|nr:alpha/beta hydrolase [Agilicoccus flavus]
MTSVPARVLRVLVALAWVGVPAWVAATRVGAVTDGHPAYALLLAAAALVGVALLVRAARRWAAENWPAGTGRARRRRWLGRALLSAATVLVLPALAWLRPYPADDAAMAAMTSGADAVTVSQDATTMTMTPSAGAAPGAAGLIFQPGARVDARAYAALLRPLAQSGHPVVIVKQPLGIAFLSLGAPGRIVADPSPGADRRWVVAGHSLGGVAAARAAASGDPRIVGLALWASYPDDATTVPAQPVVTVYGTRDGLATPAEVEASRPRLPDDARFVPVEGGIHAYFGDYGPQAGDGTATTDRATAQARIVAATRDLLDGL